MNDWQRIEKIVQWAGLSVNAFALNIGLTRGENLYQIKKGNNGISKELADLITAKYPDLSKAWIITGEGGMFLNNSPERSVIPGYDIDLIHLAEQDNLPQPSYVKSEPKAKPVDFTALMLNKSMEPEIPCGAAVMLGEINPEAIIPGNPYLIITENFSVLRKIKTEPSSEKIRLIAVNPDFDDMEVEKFEIKKLFAVRGYTVLYN